MPAKDFIASRRSPSLLRDPRHIRAVAVALLLYALPLLAMASETALDRYVLAPDRTFHYELAKTVRSPRYTTYVLAMTSQQYLTSAEVNLPIWKHWVTIVKPDRVRSDIALLFITGGDNDATQAEPHDPVNAEIALATGAVVATVSDVPNQPLVFADEHRARSEDAIIAYTWDKFLRTGEEKWPLRLPMTKAAVRAMDAVSGFLSSLPEQSAIVDRFVVSGESKRGWTTWTTAAVDHRVVAIIPVVIDLLNIVPSFEHHYRVYGSFSSQLDDYAQAGIMQWTNTLEYQKLMQIEEPFQYRDRLTMPKFIINAANDQFFLPDSSQFYFDQLQGEKYLRYVPNADHGIRDHSDAAESIAAFFSSIIAGITPPQFSWRIEKDGTIVVDSATPPLAVKLWQATNPSARDFRLDQASSAYTSRDLPPASPGHYVARVATPAKGYTAYFVELTYRSPAKYPYKFTTGVKVLPDTYRSDLPAVKAPPGSHPLINQ